VKILEEVGVCEPSVTYSEFGEYWEFLIAEDEGSGLCFIIRSLLEVMPGGHRFGD